MWGGGEDGGWELGGERRRYFLRFQVFFLACAFFFFLVCASPPARPTAQSNKEALAREGEATSARGGGEAGGWELGERGVASSCASLRRVLGLRVLLPLGLRFVPCASDATVKKGSPREGYFCALGWGGWGVGVLGEGRCFFLRFPVPSSLARVFSFFFLVCASHPARIGLSLFVFV